MKKILMIMASAVVACGCSAQIVNKVNRYNYGKPADYGHPKARQILASEQIRNYKDVHTGAIVYDSANQDYTFSVSFGTIKLQNTSNGYIEVYEYDSKRSSDWLFKERIYREGPFHEIITWTNKQPQLITFSTSDYLRLRVTVYTAAYRDGRWHKKYLLRSFTF